jgi:hypothetical protein
LKRWALLILVALASIFGLMTNSQAITSTLGANDYTFKAYDLTQVTVWSNTWNACLDPCHIPLVTATSHFGATMNTGTDLKHYWDPDITNQEIHSGVSPIKLMLDFLSKELQDSIQISLAVVIFG